MKIIRKINKGKITLRGLWRRVSAISTVLETAGRDLAYLNALRLGLIAKQEILAYWVKSSA